MMDSGLVRNMYSTLSNKCEKQLISLAFIIRLYHAALSSECQILNFKRSVRSTQQVRPSTTQMPQFHAACTNNGRSLLDFKLPPRSKCGLGCFAILGRVKRRLRTDVQGQAVGPICKGPAVQSQFFLHCRCGRTAPRCANPKRGQISAFSEN